MLTWITAFLDLAPDQHDAGLDFWERVTGYRRSEPRGAHQEYVTLLPPEGGDHLGVQRLQHGTSRIHLDLHVDDVPAATVHAEQLGAAVRETPDGYAVLTSPGGFVFCLVTHPGARPAAPADWGHGLASVVDQVCLDIPPAAYEPEVGFWQRLTGWELRHSTDRAEFRRLIRPPGAPLQLLLQRLDDDRTQVGAHLDLATTDRAREIERHVALGAVVAAERPGWTVMRPPAGPAYCITDRAPGVRLLDEPAAPG